ncbi:MAG: hypothetical protein ACI9A1_001321, partial [Lentimonas sp.]
LKVNQTPLSQGMKKGNENEKRGHFVNVNILAH